MKSTKNTLLLTLILTGLCLSLRGHAMPRECPSYVDGLDASPALSQIGESLCSIYNRYHRILVDNVVPRGLQDQYFRLERIWGPRYIDFDSFFGPKGQAAAYDPWTVYGEPTAWYQWDKTMALMTKNYINPSLGRVLNEEDPLPISVSMITELHNLSVQGSANATTAIRDHMEFGWNLPGRDAAIPVEAIRRGVMYHDTQIVKFKQIACLEDMNATEKEPWNAGRYLDIPENTGKAFMGPFDGALVPMSCSLVFYPDADRVHDLLDEVISEINGRITSHADPVATAAMAERWIVGIHPFRDGNGRTARFIMDYILQSLGLPPPILRQMNMDHVMTEERWKLEVARGMKLYLDSLEECLSRVGSSSCRITRPAL